MTNRSLALAIACLGLGALAGPARADVRVAVLPMVVHALEGHEYLRDGMADMMASRVGRVPGVSVVRVPEPAAATTNAQKAREVALRYGADYVVYGSFTAFGGGASLDLECTSAVPVGNPGNVPVRAIFVQSGTLGEIIPELDALAAKIGRFAKGAELPEGVVSDSPAVAAAPPPPAGADSASFAAIESDMRTVAARLEKLAARLDSLEKTVYAARPEKVEEADLRRRQLQEEPLP